MEAIIPYLEGLNFISGIVIAVAAVIALRQLKLAKLSMNIQSKRDALKLTAQECANYYERIVPMQNDLDQAIEKFNLNLISNWQIFITKEAIEVTVGDVDDSDKADPYFQKITDLLNAMEAFSSFFISGVADENVAYNAVGANFIDVMGDYIGWAVFCNKEGYYKGC